MRQKGFTLIEVMIAVSIAGILLAIILPNIFKENDRSSEKTQASEKSQTVQSHITVEFVDGTSQTFTSDRWDSTGDDLHIFMTGSKTIQVSIPKTRIKLWRGGR